MADRLQHDYPWTQSPMVACAPMRLIALAPLASAVSNAGGLGFVGAGSDVSNLDDILNQVATATQGLLRHSNDTLPVGVGFLLWAGDQLLADSLPILSKHKPAAAWLFAPHQTADLALWTTEIRRVTANATKIWVQVGTVGDAVRVTEQCRPDVLVVQGSDAGGHGLQHAAGLITLLPEVDDAVAAVSRKQGITPPVLVAAGGILDGRGAAAAMVLGAAGVVMGTRYLAAHEANIARGYRDAVLEAADGGVNTQRGKLYDSLRGTTAWPPEYGGRGVLNASFHDSVGGLSFEENKRRHDEALERGDAGWGLNGRLTTYAGTGVGLVNRVESAATITHEVRDVVRAKLPHIVTYSEGQ